MHFVVTLLIVLFMLKIVPYYKVFFDLHDSELPRITESLINWSNFAVMYWYLLAIGFIVFDGALAIGLQFLPDRLRWVRVFWFDSYLLLTIIVLFFGSMALCLPLTRMIEEAPPV